VSVSWNDMLTVTVTVSRVANSRGLLCGDILTPESGTE
jgi:hypothetical protein